MPLSVYFSDPARDPKMAEENFPVLQPKMQFSHSALGTRVAGASGWEGSWYEG